MLSVDVEDIADVEGAAAAAKESFSTVKEVKVVIAVLDLVRIMAKGDPGGNLSVTMELDEGAQPKRSPRMLLLPPRLPLTSSLRLKTQLSPQLRTLPPPKKKPRK